MAQFIKKEVKFSNARSVSVGAGSATVSDILIFEDNALGGIATWKANLIGTPTAGDTVDFYILGSAGDPDGNSALEFTSADATHGTLVATLDTLVTDPAIRTTTIPAFEQAKVRIVNNGASAVTASAVVKEMVG